jgi:hypothetical protein
LEILSGSQTQESNLGGTVNSPIAAAEDEITGSGNTGQAEYQDFDFTMDTTAFDETEINGSSAAGAAHRPDSKHNIDSTTLVRPDIAAASPARRTGNKTSKRPADSTTPGTSNVITAQMLIDLAITTLGTAKSFKDVASAAQMREFTRGPHGEPSPTDEEIAAAKRKVREAAAVIVEVAGDVAG